MISFKHTALALSLFALALPAAYAAPVVSDAGVVNAAGFLPPSVPGGSIAQGSFFSGFGTELGPADGVGNTSLPLPTELGGVRVTVTSGETSWDVYLTFVRADQFNGVMPSEVPVGEAEIRVIFNGETSEPVTVAIVANSFGIFSAKSSGVGPGVVTNFISDAERPVNSSVAPADPGQVITIWGTGLMGMPGADAVSPLEAGAVRDLQSTLQIAVLVGGSPVEQILYAGRSSEFPGIDQINVELAATTPAGCFVPVLAIVNGVPSNEVTIAVGSNGTTCQDAVNPLSTALIGGANLGALANVRVLGSVDLSPALTVEFTLDVMAGSFSSQSGEAFSYNRFLSLPPVGSCSRQVFRGIDLVALLGGDFPDLNFGTELDAGPTMTLTREGGDPREIAQDSTSVGRYVGTVGGGLALFGTPDPPYYEPGEFNITSEGGPGVGAIDVTFPIPARPVWLNRDAVVTDAPINRTQPLTFAWEPGDPLAPQVILALAANVSLASGSASGVVCLLPQTLGGVTLPPALLSAVPASTPFGPAGPTSLGFVGYGSLPVIEPFQAEGLDLGTAIAATVELQSVTFE